MFEGNASVPANRRMGARQEEQDVKLNLKYEAHQVIKLISPVTLCMVIVVATISTIPNYTEKDTYLVLTPFQEQTDDVGTLVWQSLANAGILVIVIAVLTALLVLAYKYRCTKLVNSCNFMLSLLFLFYFSYLYLAEILKAYNLPLDYITTYILIWNFGMMGLLSIHWKAPLIMQKAYLVFESVLIALFFIKNLPNNWTTWAVLSLYSLWDLFAVLSPFGPLRNLLETAQERNEQIPMPMYTSGMVYSQTDMVGRDTGWHSDQNEEEEAPLLGGWRRSNSQCEEGFSGEMSRQTEETGDQSDGQQRTKQSVEVC